MNRNFTKVIVAALLAVLCCFAVGIVVVECFWDATESADDQSRPNLVSDLRIILTPPSGFDGILTGAPAFQTFAVDISAKAKPHSKHTLHWAVYDGAALLVGPQNVDVVADADGAIFVDDVPFGLFCTSEGNIRGVHGIGGEAAKIRAWLGETRAHCQANDATGSNAIFVGGTWLGVAQLNPPDNVHSLTVQIDNLAKIKPTLDRTDPVPQVLKFTANITGTPNTISNNLRWSFIQENTFGITVLGAERAFSVKIDATGRASYRGECVVFANAKGQVAGSDHTTGRQQSNMLRIRVRAGSDHPARSQTFGMTGK